MSAQVHAIYEEGKLRPLEPLELPEHSIVLISVESTSKDAERKEWLEQSQRALMRVWDNEADDVYNVLLAQ